MKQYFIDLWSIMGATLKYDVQNDVHFAKILHSFHEAMKQNRRLTSGQLWVPL